jgi:transposase InsO family protein
MRGKQKTGQAKIEAAKRRTHSLEVKLQVLQEIKAGTSVADVCRAFGLARTTVELWRKSFAAGGYEALIAKASGRKKAEVKKEDPRREAVLALKQAHPEYGTRRIRDVLKRFEAIGISETEVRRTLHEAGLLEAQPPAEQRAHPERRFERAEPNQLWQSDIFTFLLRRHERIYLAAFMDDHSRYIVGHALARHQRSVLVMEALARGIARYGTPKEVLTDQGRQYTAWRGTTEFEEELRRNGIRHVKSRPQHPQTLGKIERFWKTLWDECLSRTVFADFEDCSKRVGLFIDGYNFQRPHQALEGLVPADRFFRAAAHVRAAVEAAVEENALRLSKQQVPEKPFYIIGKLGDHEMSIAAGRDGVRVKVGKEEVQTIRYAKEESNEEISSRFANPGEAAAPATAAADAEMAFEEAGAGRDRAAADADDPERAERGEAGDGGDYRGTDLEGTLLPVGGAGLEGGAGIDGAGHRPGAAGGDDDAAVAAGREGESAGEGEAATGEAAHADAQGAQAGPDEDGAGQTALDLAWAVYLNQLGQYGAGYEESAVYDRIAELDERGSWELSWPRKLAGESAPGDAGQSEVIDEQELHAAAGSAGGAAGEIPDNPASAEWGADGERGGGEAGALAQSIPDGDAQGLAGDDRGAGAETAWAFADAGEGAAACGGEGAAAAREREAAATGGDDRPADGSGERDPARERADAVDEDEEETRGRKQ